MNIGTKGVEAARNLRQNPDFRALLDALHDEVLRPLLNQALDSGAPDAIGYARGLRDLYLALEAAAAGVRPNQVQKPSVTEKRYAAA